MGVGWAEPVPTFFRGEGDSTTVDRGSARFLSSLRRALLLVRSTASGSVLGGASIKEDCRFLGEGSVLILLLVRRGVAAGGGFLVSFLLGEEPSLLSAFLFLFFLEGIVIEPTGGGSKCERCIISK